eukprot:1448500-Prymnesium_polylepis.2
MVAPLAPRPSLAGRGGGHGQGQGRPCDQAGRHQAAQPACGPCGGVDNAGVDQPKEIAKLEALTDKVLPKLKAGVKLVAKKEVNEWEEVNFAL